MFWNSLTYPGSPQSGKPVNIINISENSNTRKQQQKAKPS